MITAQRCQEAEESGRGGGERLGVRMDAGEETLILKSLVPFLITLVTLLITPAGNPTYYSRNSTYHSRNPTYHSYHGMVRNASIISLTA